MSDNRQTRRYQQKLEEQNRKLNDYVAKAAEAIQLKDNARAATMLRLTLDIQPDNSQLLYLLASILNKDGKADQAIDHARKAVSITPSNPTYQKELGISFKNLKKFSDAIPHLKEALRLKPDYADAHFAIAMIATNNPEFKLDLDEVESKIIDRNGIERAYTSIVLILNEKNQIDEAILAQKELTRLGGGKSAHLMDLGMLHMTTKNMTAEKSELGFSYLAQAVLADPDSRQAKCIFTSCAQQVMVKKFDQNIKDALSACFEKPYDSNINFCFGSWANIITLDPNLSVFAQSRFWSETDFKKWLDHIDENSQAIINDKYILQGIRLITIASTNWEFLYTSLRRYLCLNATELCRSGRYKLFLNLTCALAEQFFLSEYAFLQTKEEEDIISSINAELREKINVDALGKDTFLVALSGCYSVIGDELASQAANIKKMSSSNVAFSRMLKTHIDDIQKEKELFGSFKSFGTLANQVSQAVQQQYEENPYPRWVAVAAIKSPNLMMPAEVKAISEKPLNILVAGCGTGRHPIMTASNFENAKVTAIDLSRASLAYAKRKADEIGIASRIQFIHADILSMKDWPEQFDIIESVGVLHHMEDPLLGWKTLTEKLKPGGFFRNGLYSETARRFVVEIRKHIAENGFKSTPEGIRALRKYIIDLPPSHPLHAACNTGDFFSMSTVRDLFFHVQEHRVTLPQIQSMTHELGYRVVKFTLPNAETAQSYHFHFPDNPEINNLDNLHEFEMKFPDTFTGMYQFWCQKI